MPPVDMTPLLAIAFPGLLWLDDGSAGAGASFRLGWVFGFGFFLAGLYWIAAALFVDIAQFWWLVPLAAAGLPAGFAIYAGLALLATSFLTRRLDLAGAGAGVRFRGRLERCRMGARPCVHRPAVESDRLCLVGRISRFPRRAADGGGDRHLWAQLCNGTRRFAVGRARRSPAAVDRHAAALDAGDRSGAADPGAGSRRRDPASSHPRQS